MAGPIAFSVFTKPWPGKSLAELAAHVRQIGFDAVELPVRPKFQVAPEQVEKALPEAVRVLGEQDMRIASVAAEADERVIAACGTAGVRLVRVGVHVGRDQRYTQVIDRTARRYEVLLPALERAGVTLGVQNHCHRMISSTMGLRDLVARFDPRHVTGVLDFGHCGLAGEDPDEALDQLWPHVGLVNLKNAYWQRRHGPETTPAQWAAHWTSGPHGMCDWRAAAQAVLERGYAGDVCLPAEYSNHEQVNQLIAADLAYARQCFAGALKPAEVAVGS